MAPTAVQTIELGVIGAPVTQTLGTGILTNANFAIRISAEDPGSRLTFTGSDFYVWVNQNTTTISAPISGPGALVKAGPATLTLKPTFVVNGTTNAASPTTVVPNVPVTGTTVTLNSATVTVGSTAGLAVGQPISGTGIPSNTTIASIIDPTHITLSNTATIPGANVALTVNSVADFVQGQAISGTGIPAGSTITNVDPVGFTLSISSTITSFGTSNFTFGGAGFNNTYTGGTVVNDGTLNLSGLTGSTVIPAGGLTISSATVIENTFSGQIDPSNSVTINGDGVLTLFGTNTLKKLSFNNSGGIANPAVNINNTGMLTLTDSAAITAVNDNSGFTPTVAGVTGLLGLALTSTTPIFDVSGASLDDLIISVPILSAGGTILKKNTGNLIFERGEHILDRFGTSKWHPDLWR